VSDEPRGIEPVPVQLTRIEGTINLIAFQMAEVKTDVTKLSDRVAKVELVQASTSGSSQSWKTWLPILIAAAGVVVAMFATLGG
jgi:hypothetical protein